MSAWTPEKAKQYQERKEQRKAAGICTKCGKKPAQKGKLMCVDCNTKSRKKYEQKQKETVARREEIRKKTEEALGVPICSRCLRPTLPGKKLCREHYESLITKTAATKAANGTGGQTGHVWRKDNGLIFGKDSKPLKPETSEAVPDEPAVTSESRSANPVEIIIKGEAKEVAAFLKELGRHYNFTETEP